MEKTESEHFYHLSLNDVTSIYEEYFHSFTVK